MHCFIIFTGHTFPPDCDTQTVTIPVPFGQSSGSDACDDIGTSDNHDDVSTSDAHDDIGTSDIHDDVSTSDAHDDIGTVNIAEDEDLDSVTLNETDNDEDSETLENIDLSDLNIKLDGTMQEQEDENELCEEDSDRDHLEKLEHLLGKASSGIVSLGKHSQPDNVRDEIIADDTEESTADDEECLLSQSVHQVET